jgi:threonine dehydratase
MPLVSLSDIEDAALAIKDRIYRTPLIRIAQNGLRLKAESLQPVGSFKIRGALNALLSLSDSQRDAGVVACSSGNHAQAVAYACKTLSIRATIVMPETAPKTKIDATRAWGAEVVIHGRTSDEIMAHAQELSSCRGAPIVHPYDSAATIAGAATVGLEILADAPDVKRVFVPVAGGGLLSGVAAAVKLSNPAIKVIGAEPALASDAYRSLQTGHIVSLSPDEAGRTIADGLRVQRLAELTWKHVRAFVDEIQTVTEDEIKSAMRFLAAKGRLVGEPSGAVSVAAALQHGDDIQPGNVAVLSGGNVDLDALAEVLR